MQRWSSVLVILLVAPAAAQTLVLEDPDDDAAARAAGTVDVDGYDTREFDLMSFTVMEFPDGFEFTLKVRGLDKEPQTVSDSGQYAVDFQHADVTYRLLYFKQVLFGSSPSFGAQVQMYDSGRQTFVTQEFAPLDVDRAQGMMTMRVPREWLLDGNGTAPTLGRELALFRAFSRSSTINFGGPFGSTTPFRIEDSMPDSGFGTINYLVQHGLRQTGHARLSSDNPVRASNGEQATFVYYIVAENMDAAQDRFDLSVSGVPSGWQVTLPAPTIRIDGNASQPFPVLVSTPFAHQHGAFESFVLKMTSNRDSRAIGQLQVGIRYLEIPQPAGHHDRVWIHARSNQAQGFTLPGFGGPASAVGYMNAMEDDPRAEALEIPPTNNFCCPIGQTQYVYDVWLEPSLQLGLDFDLNRTGTLEVEFTSDVPASDAVVSGQLLHFARDERNTFGPTGGGTILGEFAPTPPAGLSGPVKFETVFTPKKEADLVAYNPNAALLLRLNLQVASGSVVAQEDLMPRLLPTGVMRLPLFEYRDPVEDVFNTLAGISLKHDGGREKYVNPSETVLFNLTITNEGAVDDVFRLKVNGTNQDWARILGDKVVFIPTGAKRPLVIAVTAPKSALDGDVVDLIVTAASDAEPAVQGNARVVAVVDELVDRTDEAYLIKDLEKSLTTKKDSPGLPLVAALAVLAAVLVRRR